MLVPCTFWNEANIKYAKAVGNSALMSFLSASRERCCMYVERLSFSFFLF